MTDKMSTTDYPAFPVAAGQQVYATGMSLRDWFAGQALAGLTASPDPNHIVSLGASDSLSATCYLIADAMLSAREGRE